jgi:hypothetical protein
LASLLFARRATVVMLCRAAVRAEAVAGQL